MNNIMSRRITCISKDRLVRRTLILKGAGTLNIKDTVNCQQNRNDACLNPSTREMTQEGQEEEQNVRGMISTKGICWRT